MARSAFCNDHWPWPGLCKVVQIECGRTGDGHRLLTTRGLPVLSAFAQRWSQPAPTAATTADV